MQLLKEMKQLGFPVTTTEANIHAKVFEDNSSAIEIANNPKYHPRTKHLNNRLHHFRDYVERGEVSIHRIGTGEQITDYLTKPLGPSVLTYLRQKVMGW